LSEDLKAWATEISIVPVADDKMDLWDDNGFANISGEFNLLRQCCKKLLWQSCKINKLYQESRWQTTTIQ